MSSSPPENAEESVSFSLAFLEALRSSDSTQSIIESLAHWLPRFIESQHASISLVRDETHFSISTFASDGEIPVAWPLPMAETSCGWCFENRQTRIVSDIAEPEPDELDLRTLAKSGLRSVISVPLVSGRECLGTLNLAHGTPHFYTAAHARQLENLALLVAPQIALWRRAELVEAAGRQKSAFLAKLSHEIRMPLNSVLGMGQLLKNTALDQTQVAFVEAVLESGRSLSRLVEDLQDVAQLEAGLLTLESAPFELSKLVGQTVEDAAAAAAQKGLTVWSHLSEHCATRYVGDADRIRRVLFNLVDNAVKYTPAGEVKITVAPSADGALRFTVADSGPGISPSQLQEILQQFRRAEITGSRQSNETGLGLAMAGRLVAMMDGHAEVQSDLGHGATFWFELPLGNVLGDTCGPATAGSLAPSPSRTANILPVPAAASLTMPADSAPAVLLAEDNGLNQELMLCALEPLGLDIVTATNGAEALKRLREQPFDLVLMDIQMPIMTGDEAIRQIRASNESYAEVPIIALTANAMQGAREEYLNAGATAYLAKPINIQELIHKVLSYARPQSDEIAVS